MKAILTNCELRNRKEAERRREKEKAEEKKNENI